MSICIQTIVHQGTSYSLRWYLEGPIFRRSYVQKALCSENICSEGSMFRWYFIHKVICLEGHIFRRSCIQKIFVQKVLFWNTFPSFSFRYKNIFFILVHFTLLFYFLHNFIINFFLGYTRMRFEDPTFSELQISKFPKFPELGNPNKPKFQCSEAPSSCIICVSRCVFFVIDWYSSFLTMISDNTSAIK